MYFCAPEVIPITRRQMNVLRVNLFRDDWRDEEIRAEEELDGSGMFQPANAPI